MRDLHLFGGHTAFVDDEDYERVAAFKWSRKIDTTSRTFYARCCRVVDGRWTTEYLHRMVLQAPKGVLVDHINRDGLDCRRRNLRFADRTLNGINQNPSSINTSGTRGVTYDPQQAKWRTRIAYGGKRRHIGWFPTLRLAVEARDRAEQEYFAWLQRREAA